MNDVIREFLLETHENLGQLDADLVALEKNPTEKATLARVFRTLHTVKGSAGFLGLIKLQAVAHSAENLLSRLRSGELILSPPIATALLRTVDAIRQVLAKLEASGGEGSGDYTGLVRELDRLREGSAAPAPPPTMASPAPAVAKPATAGVSPVSEPLPSQVVEARAPAVADSSVRVDVGLLDKLMTLVGELVLARNQIIQLSGDQEYTPFLGTVQRLSALTSELQASVMKTRLQPIGIVWSKFPRVVRDLSVACGKQVRIDMEGQETELDRTIIEAIRDPLTHIVRNAVDHGIEKPAVRTERGKPPEGRLSLHAFHEGGKVIIEIEDDGGGIDATRVRDKAIASKLISPEAAARMNEKELVNLVFLPGFSTAERVTEFSGRGVGMDVVRINIERVGGAVDLDSRFGKGTVIRMKIPLTLAIIPALIVKCGQDRFAIPQVSLQELLRMEGEQVLAGIERVHNAPVYRLRGQLLPLAYLDREMQLASVGSGSDAINIVVLQADEHSFGLVVDGIHNTEEIVVKPLQKLVKGAGLFSGATIMGDGRVALILDVRALAQRAGLLSGIRDGTVTTIEETAPRPGGDQQTVLLCAIRGGRIAIPLSRVTRLEEFPRSVVERAGRRRMVQYRGELLPLLDVAKVLRRMEPREKSKRRSRKRVNRLRRNAESLHVVVCSGPQGQIGLVVNRILDVVEATIAARARAARPGVLYTAAVHDRVTEFLDLDKIIGSAAGIVEAES
jgi:two-component system chemotaxis sensor kinase CheA